MKAEQNPSFLWDCDTWDRQYIQRRWNRRSVFIRYFQPCPDQCPLVLSRHLRHDHTLLMKICRDLDIESDCLEISLYSALLNPQGENSSIESSCWYRFRNQMVPLHTRCRSELHLQCYNHHLVPLPADPDRTNHFSASWYVKGEYYCSSMLDGTISFLGCTLLEF